MQVDQLKQHFIVTDLERRLKSDSSGSERDRILGELLECELRIESQKRSGLSADDFANADALLRSLRVSSNVVREAWNSFHRTRTAV